MRAKSRQPAKPIDVHRVLCVLNPRGFTCSGTFHSYGRGVWNCTTPKPCKELAELHLTTVKTIANLCYSNRNRLSILLHFVWSGRDDIITSTKSKSVWHFLWFSLCVFRDNEQIWKISFAVLSKSTLTIVPLDDTISTDSLPSSLL